MSDYSYDRRAGKKLPVSQRSIPQQVRYWVSGALSWLKAGGPSAAGDHLAKALSLLDNDADLRKNTKLRDLIKEARTQAYSTSPRAADYTVEKALKLLPDRDS